MLEVFGCAGLFLWRPGSGSSLNRVRQQAGGTDETDNFYKDAQRTFGTAYRNTPGTSLFWTKGALDYLVLNNVSENLNPGYQQRLMDRAQKTRGQSYLMGGAGPQSSGEQ